MHQRVRRLKNRGEKQYEGKYESDADGSPVKK